MFLIFLNSSNCKFNRKLFFYYTRRHNPNHLNNILPFQSVTVNKLTLKYEKIKLFLILKLKKN